MLLPINWLTATFLIFSLPAFAIETSTLNSSVRALGMGDAFTAVATDESSLFYNPAGLARVKGLNWRVFDLDAGASGVSAYSKISGMKTGGGGAGFASAINSLYGEHVWVGAGGESIFTMPMLGIGVYDHAGATVRVNNPVYPGVHTRILNDYGYVLGIGVPLAPVFHMGFDLKYIKRTGSDNVFGPATLADLQPGNIADNLTGWGAGYGADVGMSVVIPTPVVSAVMSAAWKNIGGIQFRSAGGSVIPDEKNNMTLGGALTFDTPVVSVTPAVDVVYLNDANLQLTRKINMGIEIGLPLLDIRGGFHEGYYTAGLGVNLGLFRVDAATYGVELGDYPGQIEDRRYVLQFTMELGVGNFSAIADDKKSGPGGHKGSASSESIWGSKRLKQRR